MSFAKPGNQMREKYRALTVFFACYPISCLVGDATPAADPAWTCNDNFVCAPDENQSSCPHDCYYPAAEPRSAGTIARQAGADDLIYDVCLASLNYTMASVCGRYCGNLHMDEGEDATHCPKDFPPDTCGNGLCDFAELPSGDGQFPIELCPTECHEPADGGFGDLICDVSELYINSPTDCSGDCGDGVCSLEEFTSKEPWCARDCDQCLPDECYFPNDGACETGKAENIENSPEDCRDPFCGDKVVSAGEACDDGNLVDTDACTSACKLATCGDGVVYAEMMEQCDDKNTDDTDACLGTCKTARCGDGVVQAGVESCDDGNVVQTDACRNNCTPAGCGDGVVQAGLEMCDDGNLVNTDACLATCMPARCGDGITQAGVEACDDGNKDELDDCRSDCTPIIHRRVFVTSAELKGDFGGVTGADKICQMAAMGAKFDDPNTFKAWLSDSVQGPWDRFDTSFSGIYELPDGTVVVRGGWSDLTDGDLEHAIDQDEIQTVVAFSFVWSNTKPDGTPAILSHCKNWSNSGFEDGNAGKSDVSIKDAAWTQAQDISCASASRIYCFEDP